MRLAGHLGNAVAGNPTVITTSTIKNVAKKPDLTSLFVKTSSGLALTSLATSFLYLMVLAVTTIGLIDGWNAGV